MVGHSRSRTHWSPEEREEVHAHDRHRKAAERECLPYIEKQSKRKHKRIMANNTSVDLYNMTEYIRKAVKISKRHLHQTKFQDDPRKHQAYVFVVCDRVIVGTESLRSTTMNNIKLHSNRLGVYEYEQYHQVKLTKFL